jgi:phage gpG-like protein
VILTGDWYVARRILANAPRRVRAAIDQAVLQEAHFMRGKIVEGLRDQEPGGRPFRPLADSTLKVRAFKRFRGTKALIVRGDLRNSITVQREREGAFVGVLRTARGRGGQPLANIAELNEFGSRPIVIRITPKMRRFLAAALGGGGTGTGGGGGGGAPGIIVVQIPARPFIRPVQDKYFGDRAEVRQRFLGRIATILGGDFGGPGSSSEGAAIARSRRMVGSGRSGGFGSLGAIFGGGGGGPARDPRTGRFVGR